MSGRPSPPADESSADDAGPWSLRRLAKAWPRAIVTAWAVLVVVLLARVLGDPGVEVSGDAQGLLPLEHRAPDDELLVLLTIDDDALADEQGGVDVLLGAASAVAERLGERRIQLGPPAAELTAWIDAHALYLLPVQAHQALAERLSDAAMTRAVDALRARLSSPLYGLSGEEPRRDPLRLQDLSQEQAGRLTHLGNPADMPAELTAAGDLMALDGHMVLMQVRSDAEPDALLEEIRGALPSSAVDVALVGPGPRRARDRTVIEEQWTRVLVLGLAGLVVVLSLALRAIRPVAAIILALGTVLVGMLAFGPPLDPHGVPILVLLLGFGCEGALHLTRISPRGWPAAAVLGGALLPLLLSPYPAWQAWALWWLGGVAAAVVLLRLLVPALLVLWKLSPAPARRGFRLHPLRPLAVLLAVAALAAGAWGLQRIPFLEIDRTPRPTADDDPERAVRERFFDPRLVVRAWSKGDTAASALEQAAEHSRQLATLVPGDATRVDSPGRLVLPLAELQSRKRSLEALELPARMAALHDLLATRGFRPDAFGEFSRGAANLDDLPTPQAALEGPLGPWIRGYLEAVEGGDDGGGTALVTRVHVRPDSSAPIPVLETEAGVLELRGPAVAARRDRQRFEDWLGIYVACQLWLGALAVWLGTRSLPTALGCSVAALAAQTAVLAVMVPTGLSLGPALLPALLLVGAAAMIAGARACRSVSQDERFHATGVLLSGLCQAVAGLALLATTHPLWSQVGLLVAMGAVLASGAGLFVAPGMMRLFGGIGAGSGRARSQQPQPPPKKDPEADPEEGPERDPKEDPAGGEPS